MFRQRLIDLLDTALSFFFGTSWWRIRVWAFTFFDEDVCIAIDVSGGIGNEEIKVFFEEVERQNRSHRCVSVVEWDTEIREDYIYSSLGDVQYPASNSRGGTLFDPVVEWANERVKILQKTSLIVFTDGYFPLPKAKLNMPVLWVVTPSGSLNALKNFPGSIVQVNHESVYHRNNL